MRLEIGTPDYPHETPVGSAFLVGTRPNRPLPLIVISMEDMKDLRDKLAHVSGIPTMIAHDEEAGRIWLHPSPNGEYELELKEPDKVAKAG